MARKLTSLGKNESSVITKIQHSDISDKLFEFGVFTGSHLEMIEKLPFNGPVYIRVDESRICLRSSEAEAIWIE